MARILIVEDVPTSRRLLALVLGKRGHDVIQTSDGFEALEAVKASRPDLVITDLLMPRMDGFEFARRMSLDPQVSRTRLLFYTAEYKPWEVDVLRHCGLDVRSFPKPWSPEELLRVVDEMLQAPPPPVPLQVTQTSTDTYRQLMVEKLVQKIGELEDEIRERRRVEELLESQTAALTRSNRQLAQFASVIAHDLQEPARMQILYAQRLEEKLSGQLAPECQVALQTVLDSARKLHELIRDLHRLSRLPASEIILEVVSLESVLDQVITHLAAIIQETGTVIDRRSLPKVSGNNSLLVQLLQNLLENAIKYRGTAPPRIVVDAIRSGDHWVVGVEDNGRGFEPQYSEKIFELFERLDPAGGIPGTGVGLAICKSVVERHGGRIWASSRPGEGARFHFTLQPEPGH